MVKKILMVLLICGLQIITSQVIISPFEKVTSKTIMGGLVAPIAYCQVTKNGIVWDDEDVCVSFRDIWGTWLYSCCHEDTWVKTSDKDCPDSKTGVRSELPMLSNDRYSGPETRNSKTFHDMLEKFPDNAMIKRLFSGNERKFRTVMNGDQVAMTRDGHFVSRNANDVFQNMGNDASCKFHSKPMMNLKCDDGFEKLPRKIIRQQELTTMRKGDKFVNKLTLEKSNSVKLSDSTSYSATLAMSNERSAMVGGKLEFIDFSANVKNTLSGSTTVTQTSGKEVTMTNSEKIEQSYEFNCDDAPCHIIKATVMDCSQQEISKCTFVDQLPTYADVKPGSAKIMYCFTSETIINSKSSNINEKDQFAMISPIKKPSSYAAVGIA